ncbi:hypothetical protein NSMM_470062 [Nitrosomonas mobilis]|uniref:Uncharacterized protein n=1 Tax=Nitrosomonas mobilis TaxID=51642 RepID=A0A1G5SFM6_9PROT|nr:hypothetical protein NSMM_470062 [Nitrosomonas mobilis]
MPYCNANFAQYQAGNDPGKLQCVLGDVLQKCYLLSKASRLVG